MSADQPLIETGYVRINGISPQTFENPPAVGEQRIYTVLAVCKDRKEDAAQSEGGTRWTHNLNLLAIAEGLTMPVAPAPKGKRKKDDDTEIEGQTSLADIPEDEPAEAVDGGSLSEFQGPQFSAGD